MKPSSAFRNRIIKHLREWHRRLGIVAAFFLIFLSFTGIALNHIDSFALAKHKIKSAWLLDYYGIKPPQKIRFYSNNHLVITDNFVWFNDKLLFEGDDNTAIVSAGKFKQYLYIVTTSEIIIFDLHGSILDRLDETTGLPVPIEEVRVTEEFFIVNSANRLYQASADFIEWLPLIENNTKQHSVNKPIKGERGALEQVSTTPSVQQLKAIENYRSQFLSWERVILDTHSGRIFGLFGVLFMDFIALLLILLSVSGVYIWLRYARNKR
jgi:hypothetical protein